MAAQLQSPAVQQIADTIKDTYCTLRARRIEESVFRPRCVTLNAFYQQGLIRQFPPEVAMQLDDRVQQMDFGVTLIIAGVDRNGAHVFGISDPGISTSYGRIGYHAIGSGLSHALLSLVASGQHRSLTTKETAFNVFRAKRQAEVAPGVGRSVELRIITSGGVHQASDEELATLDQILNDLEAPRSEEMNKRISELPFQ